MVASQQDFAILWKILLPRNAAGVPVACGVARLDMPIQVASDSTARVSIYSSTLKLLAFHRPTRIQLTDEN